MEAQPEITQNISSLKLPMLKTRDYDLWSMRMEQYLTHTDYALWEVIIIGDSLVLEPPAVGTVVYEAEIKGKSSSGSNSHNVAFVSSENTSSINETVNATHGIPAAGLKKQPFVSSYADDVMFSFFASQSNTLQLDNEDLEQINIEDLEEMDLKWQVAMITMRVKKFMKRTGRNLNFNGNEPVGFDKTKVECYNCHRRGHFARECRALRNQGNRSTDNERRVVLVETPVSALVVQDGLGRYNWSYQAEEGPIDFALMAHSTDSANSLNSELEETMKEKDDLKEKLTNFEESVSEIDKDNNKAKDRYKVGIWYHVVPPPYTRNYMPPRADLFFAGLDDYVFKFKISETRTSVHENESIASKSSEEIREEPKTVRSSALIIEDWESDYVDECEDKTSTEQEIPTNDNLDKSAEFATKSGKVLVNAAKQNSTASTSTARPKVNIAAIRPNVNAKSSYFNPHFPKRRHFNQRSVAKTNTFSRKINTAKGKNVTTARPKAVVNAAEGKKENDQGIFDSGCSRHMTGNKSFLIEYQEIDGGFVSFGGSLKGGKISGDLNCLFAKATIDESNLWHRRLGHINFKTLNKLVRGNLVRARTMLADSLLPTMFWAEAVNTACYVQNRVLVTNSHNKTPYELLISRSPNLEFIRPFGCHVTILNTLDHLGKFDGKADKGPEWLFDIDSLTKSMNYEPVSAGNQSNGDACIQTDIHAGQTSQEKAVVHEYILLPFISSNPPLSLTIQSSDVNAGDQPGDVNTGDIQGDVDEISRNDDVCQGNEIRIDSSTHAVNTASTSINTASNIIAVGSLNINTTDFNHTNMPTLEATGIFNGAFDDRDLGAEADTNNLDSSIIVSHIPTTSVHKDHPKEQIIGDPNLNTKTRRIINFSEETAMFSFINRQRRRNHKDF
nr:ribonuclease H-like domain-containing protein [Tanacetum cinerariifolium]